MPVSDFYELFLFEQMEPFGERGANLRAGTLASLIFNVNRGKDQKALKAEDFFPTDPKPVREQTPEEQFAAFEFIRAIQNARQPQ